MSTYSYTPLRAELGTRLLKIHPGSPASPLLVTITPVDLANENLHLSYDALSYVWGSELDPVSIDVVDNDSSPLGSLSVTHNLAAALLHLRDAHEPRIVWADAICINQRDMPERSRQVAHMAHFYRAARRVPAFLGPEFDGSALAMDVLRRVARAVDIDFSSGRVTPSSSALDMAPDAADWADLNRPFMLRARELGALYHLIGRPWFGRLWIRQEIGLAGPRGLLVCGRDELPWPDFCKAIIVLRRKAALSSLADDLAQRLAAAEDVALFSQRGFSLLSLRQQTRHARCLDPRDRIYGVLSQLRGAHASLGIVPDYEASTAEVYADVTRRYLARFGDLLILNQCDFRTELDELPSWVPDWSQPLLSSQIHNVPPDLFQRMASINVADNRTLRSGGVHCGRIIRIERFSQDVLQGDMDNFARAIQALSSSLEATDHPYVTGETVMEALFCTLCLDDVAERWHPPAQSQPVYKDCAAIFTPLFHADPPISCEADIGLNLLRYLNQARDACRERCFFVTDQGHIGLAPAATEINDSVVFLFGGNRPMVLRPASETATQHLLIGSCYAHGQMQGESLLGSLPTHIREVMDGNSAQGVRIVGFMNRKTGDSVSQEDTRVGRFLENLVERGFLESPSLAELDAGLDVLAKAGFPVGTYELV